MRTLLGGMSLALACLASYAAEPLPSLNQYSRTSWESKDGAPSGVWAIAETSDGWLWFGGPTGLYRFDGIRFTRMALEPAGSTVSEHVSALFATDAGPLLIGRYNGGFDIFEGGRFRHFPDESKRAATVLAFALDSDGVYWAGTRNGMVRFEGASWRRATSDWNLPETRIESLLLDHAGTLWASTPTEVMHLPRGGRRFQSDGIAVDSYGELIVSPDGRAWLADSKIVRPLPGQMADDRYDPRAASRSGNGNLFAHDSRFWTSNEFTGHLTVPNAAPSVALLPGFPHIGIEDREGNLWLGTAGNFIHRLHRKVFTEIASPGFGKGGLDVGIAASANSVVWMASSYGNTGGAQGPSDGLFRYDGHATQRVVGPASPVAIKRIADGSIWAAGGQRPVAKLRERLHSSGRTAGRP